MRKFCAKPVTWFSASKKEIAAPTAPSDFSGPLHRLGAGLGCALSGTWTDRNICGAPGELPWGGHILPNMDKRGQEPQSPTADIAQRGLLVAKADLRRERLWLFSFILRLPSVSPTPSGTPVRVRPHSCCSLQDR